MLFSTLMDMHGAKFRTPIERWDGFARIEQARRIKRRLYSMENPQLQGRKLTAHLVDFL